MLFKKNIYCITLLLLQSLQGIAQQKSSSLLWEISGNGLSQSSYLFGTIHLIDKKDFTIRKEIDSIFELTNQIAFEIKMDDPDALAKIQDWFPLPEGKSLQDYCTPAEYEKITKYLTDSLETDINQYKNLKPFGVAQLQVMGYADGEVASYEGYFMTQALLLQKPIKGLESIDDQLKLFDVIPYEEQIDWMIQGIDSTAEYNNIWSKLIIAYKNEDLPALWQLFKESSPELVKYQDMLISGRNIKWIPVIEEMIKSSSTFIAVGAGHLPGENGLLDLLRNHGYSLRPL